MHGPNKVEIDLVEGTDSPYYGEVRVLLCKKAVIIEQGYLGRLPLVDFVLTDREGRDFVLTLSGRIIQAISSVCRGTEQRLSNVWDK
jgi:hypothetical protein